MGEKACPGKLALEVFSGQMVPAFSACEQRADNREKPTCGWSPGLAGTGWKRRKKQRLFGHLLLHLCHLSQSNQTCPLDLRGCRTEGRLLFLLPLAQ